MYGQLRACDVYYCDCSMEICEIEEYGISHFKSSFIIKYGSLD